VIRLSGSASGDSEKAPTASVRSTLALVGWVDIEQQVNLEIRQSAHQLEAENGAAVTIEKPPDEELNVSAFSSDLVEKGL
jgi:maltose-binding protein MalE